MKFSRIRLGKTRLSKVRLLSNVKSGIVNKFDQI